MFVRCSDKSDRSIGDRILKTCCFDDAHILTEYIRLSPNISIMGTVWKFGVNVDYEHYVMTNLQQIKFILLKISIFTYLYQLNIKRVIVLPVNIYVLWILVILFWRNYCNVCSQQNQ